MSWILHHQDLLWLKPFKSLMTNIRHFHELHLTAKLAKPTLFINLNKKTPKCCSGWNKWLQCLFASTHLKSLRAFATSTKEELAEEPCVDFAKACFGRCPSLRLSRAPRLILRDVFTLDSTCDPRSPGRLRAWTFLSLKENREREISTSEILVHIYCRLRDVI